MKKNSLLGFSLVEMLLVLTVLIVLVTIGLFIYHQPEKAVTSTSSSPSPPVISSLLPPTIPNNKAYLGAFINPEHLGLGESGSIPGSNVIQQLPAFNQLIGQHVAIVHFYAPMKTPLPTSTLNSIYANGSIPMISWGCADVSAISAGQYDNTINSYANGLKAVGKPVFLRWYWEMNQMNAAGKTPAGSNCNGYNNGPGYIAAWRHIYTLFHKDGATNVAFVWCPGYSGGNFSTYYPGDQYVDWIGLDRYERTTNGQKMLSYSDMYSSFYQEWIGHNKPYMIAETAAMGSSDQSQYISSIISQASSLPNIKAFVWFDSTGPAGDWSLQGNGVDGFKSLAQSTYFQ